MLPLATAYPNPRPDMSDEPTLPRVCTQPVPAKLAKVAAHLRLLVLDVDGVLTDGGLLYDAAGETLKRFHVHDGQGLKLLQQCGMLIAVISGRHSEMVQRRCAELGIDELVQGQEQKLPAAEDLLSRHGLSWSTTAVVGDDLPDLPLLLRAALSIAPANANVEVRQRVDWVTNAGGGGGAVREVCDALLLARDQRDAALARFLA